LSVKEQRIITEIKNIGLNMPNLEKKFSKVYDKLVGKIYRFVFLKVNTQEVAEDITSQVFAKAWNKVRKSEKEIKNLSAYIYQIARAELVNYYKNKSKYTIVSAENVQIVDQSINLEEKEQINSETDNLFRFIQKLNDDYRNVIIWRYLDDLSYKEIAEIMEKPEGTIRVMVHRALKELRKIVEKFENNQ